jgi:hypothetical protein
MFPLAMGVVMALFGMSNGLYAAQKVQPSLRFYSSPAESTEREHLPTPEEDAFARLKENEEKRALCRSKIALCLKRITTPDVYEKELATDLALIQESVRLFKAYTKNKGIESSTSHAVSGRVAKKAGRYNACYEKARIIVATADDTFTRCKNKKQQVPTQECDRLQRLLTDLHAIRMSSFDDWALHVKDEASITAYHIEAFKYYLASDMLFNEVQTAIVARF